MSKDIDGGFFCMARAFRDQTRTSDKVIRLAKATTATHTHLADQLVHNLGTSRRSEVRGKMGSEGKTYEHRMSEYLDSL